MHQNQWLAAIEGLHADGLHQFQIPSPFPLDRVMMSQMHTFWNLSQGTESEQGGWAKGPTPDGLGTFEYLTDPQPLTDDTGEKQPGDPRLHGTPKQPMPAVSEGPNPMEGQKVPDSVDKDAVKKSAKA
jgi:Mn-containing catalase